VTHLRWKLPLVALVVGAACSGTIVREGASTTGTTSGSGGLGVGGSTSSATTASASSASSVATGGAMTAGSSTASSGAGTGGAGTTTGSGGGGGGTVAASNAVFGVAFDSFVNSVYQIDPTTGAAKKIGILGTLASWNGEIVVDGTATHAFALGYDPAWAFGIYTMDLQTGMTTRTPAGGGSASSPG
jgi:hypothetical protein